MIPPIHKSIFIRATPAHAFATFARGGWWPKEHSILASGSPQKAMIVEDRAGGRWYEVGEDGSECVWGRVLAYDPPHRLLLTWQINGDFQLQLDASSEVELTFLPEDDGTRVTLEHRGFEAFATTGLKLRDAVGGEGGWGSLLQMMARAIGDPPVAPPRYFFCRLILPRATFMEDMSEAEGQALGAHIAYWKGLLAQKKSVIFGPIGDPAGVWGMGILSVADELEAQKLAAKDPAITSALGFRHEVMPMLQAVVA